MYHARARPFCLSIAILAEALRQAVAVATGCGPNSGRLRNISDPRAIAAREGLRAAGAPLLLLTEAACQGSFTALRLDTKEESDWSVRLEKAAIRATRLAAHASQANLAESTC